MNIHYFTNHPSHPGFLQQYLTAQGFTLAPYDPDNPEAVSVLLLFSPLWVNGQYVSAERVWKSYFQRQARLAEIRLITAGFEPVQHSNHLYLLQLPTDFGQFLQQALPCSAEWEPIPTRGMDMYARLERFFMGHGKESILEEFSKIWRLLKSLHQDVQKGVPFEIPLEGLGIQEYVPAFWTVFSTRWRYYYPNFETLPFYQKFQYINALIPEIEPFFMDGCSNAQLFDSCKCFENIDTIKNLLYECGKYIR